jgi:FAD/FMN-containing dehydrogenase
MSVLQSLEKLFGPEKVLTDQDSLQQYGKDWTKAYQPNPLAIVFPESTEQVQALVKLANQEGFALVPSGGRTGLSGGAIATNKEVVVAFDRMNQILDFNALDRSVICQAGVITRTLQDLAAENNLFYPVDFASSGSSQIGGNISTNAGGIKVVGYGLTRNWVLGLKVVTGEGKILELNHGLVKNATGYDIRHLFIGSEGTLGFITEATMRLARAPKNLSVLVLGVTGIPALMNVFEAFQNVLDLTAFEFFSELTLNIMHKDKGYPKPFDEAAPFYALIEFENDCEDRESKALGAFEYCSEQGWVIDGVMSQSIEQARKLWRLREDISETISAYTPYKNDLSVKISNVPTFLDAVDALVAERYAEFEVLWYGHIGDGNLHLNILKPAEMNTDEFFAKCKKVNNEVFEITHKMRGSISAEHGVGLLKRDYLKYSRSNEEIAAMRALKAVFDPNGIMNPGKLLVDD